MSRTKDKSLKRAKEARGGGHFLPVPLSVLQSDALANLSPYGCKLLLDICSQWRLGHNGDSSATWSIMQKKRWKSKDTLNKALKELCGVGLIILTRQGGRHLCSLYGLGWLAINECGGKLDIKASSKPINHFAPPLKIKAPATPAVSIIPKNDLIDSIGVAQRH